MPLTQAIAPVAPPAAVWRRIEARLWRCPTKARRTPPQRWWQQLVFWRGLSAFAGSPR